MEQGLNKLEQGFRKQDKPGELGQEEKFPSTVIK